MASDVNRQLTSHIPSICSDSQSAYLYHCTCFTNCSKEIPGQPNKFKNGALSQKGVGQNTSGELKNGNEQKKNGVTEQKKESKADKPTPSSSLEQGVSQSQSELSADLPEEPAYMDISESASLSSSFITSASVLMGTEPLSTSMVSDYLLATSISSPKTMTEFSEDTKSLYDLGMRRQREAHRW